jgi:hypothetical protein
MRPDSIAIGAESGTAPSREGLLERQAPISANETAIAALNLDMANHPMEHIARYSS